MSLYNLMFLSYFVFKFWLETVSRFIHVLVMYQNFITFHGWIIFCYMYPHLVYPGTHCLLKKTVGDLFLTFWMLLIFFFQNQILWHEDGISKLQERTIILENSVSLKRQLNKQINAAQCRNIGMRLWDHRGGSEQFWPEMLIKCPVRQQSLTRVLNNAWKLSLSRRGNRRPSKPREPHTATWGEKRGHVWRTGRNRDLARTSERVKKEKTAPEPQAVLALRDQSWEHQEQHVSSNVMSQWSPAHFSLTAPFSRKLRPQPWGLMQAYHKMTSWKFFSLSLPHWVIHSTPKMKGEDSAAWRSKCLAGEAGGGTSPRPSGEMRPGPPGKARWEQKPYILTTRPTELTEHGLVSGAWFCLCLEPPRKPWVGWEQFLPLFTWVLYKCHFLRITEWISEELWNSF